MKKVVVAFVAIALLILCASEPTWILFATGGVVAGLWVRRLVRYIRRFPRKAFYLGLVAACVLLALFTIPSFFIYRMAVRNIPLFGRAKYSADISYVPVSDSWTVKDDLLVLDTADIQRQLHELRYREAIRRMQQGGDLPKVHEDPGELARILSSCGWEQQGTVDSTLHMVQLRTIQLRTRWLPLHTIKDISLPVMSCQSICLNLDSASRAVLNIPKYMVVRTFPAISSRNEMLLGENERLVLPLDLSPGETAAVQLEVASPLARNKLGSLILKGAIWKPLNWIFLAFCGIFSEQIKKGLLIPAAKFVFRFLHIPFKEEDSRAKGDESHEIPLQSETEPPPE